MNNKAQVFKSAWAFFVPKDLTRGKKMRLKDALKNIAKDTAKKIGAF